MRQYPGIQGIGFSLRIDPEEQQQVVNRMQRDVAPDFQLWPESDDPRHAIIYLEPLDDKNRLAVGFNMFHEPIRRQAMEAARDRSQELAAGS